MSTDRETTSIVRSWLEEGVTVLPDRVLDAVLEQVPATPQRRRIWPARRFAQMHNMTRVAIAAAAVLAIALVGYNLLPRLGVGVVPSVAPSAARSTGIDGIYSTSFTRVDLTTSPMLADAAEINDGNWGEWQLTFREGRVSYSQHNAVTSTSASGTFTVTGDAITLAFDSGANRGETFGFRWSLAGNELTFVRDATLGPGPTPFLVKSWSRIAPA
jgi:hypothetical protein